MAVQKLVPKMVIKEPSATEKSSDLAGICDTLQMFILKLGLIGEFSMVKNIGISNFG